MPETTVTPESGHKLAASLPPRRQGIHPKVQTPDRSSVTSRREFEIAAVRHDAVTLIEFLADLLVQAGFSKNEASAIAKSLTLSERLGYASHGIAQISRYIAEPRAGNVVSGATPRTLQETPNSLVVDAQLGAGQVVMPIVLRNVYSKLATQASVTAAVRNCGHVGRLGEWVEHPAEAGYAALLFVNDNGFNRIVAPPGGRCGVTSSVTSQFINDTAS